MRNNNRKLLIIALMAVMVLGGFSPMLFATAGDNKPPACPQLHIQLVWPTENLEGQMTFIVEVVDAYGAPVEGATVHVEKVGGGDSFPTRGTDYEGVAEWINVYKFVDETTVYRVWATKVGYVFDGEYKYYTVTNRALHFVVLPYHNEMDEQTFEYVCVEDQYDNPIDCWVYFQGIPYWTGVNGCALIYAFDVTAENVLENPWVSVSIDAYKETPYHYDSAHDEIRVQDLDDVEVTLKCDVDFAEGGDPVPDADVYIIVGGDGHNTTNQSGKCQFYVFPDTTIWGTYYTLMALYPGYWPCTYSLRVHANPGSSWDFDFNLVEIPWWIEDIVDLEILDLTEDTELETYSVELEAAPSSGSPELYSYEWDFGDGNFSVTDHETTSHDYDEPGRYIITVTAISPTQATEYGEIHLMIC